MPRGHTHILNVIGPHTLLGGCGARHLAGGLTQEHGLELKHAWGVGGWLVGVRGG